MTKGTAKVRGRQAGSVEESALAQRRGGGRPQRQASGRADASSLGDDADRADPRGPTHPGSAAAYARPGRAGGDVAGGGRVPRARSAEHPRARGLRPARQRVGGGQRPGPPSAAVPLSAPPAPGRRSAAAARRRPRAGAAEAGLERRHDAPPLRARRAAGEAGSADAAARDPPGPLPRGIGPARAVAA
jgi:hypothetical protein